MAEDQGISRIDGLGAHGLEHRSAASAMLRLVGVRRKLIAGSKGPAYRTRPPPGRCHCDAPAKAMPLRRPRQLASSAKPPILQAPRRVMPNAGLGFLSTPLRAGSPGGSYRLTPIESAFHRIGGREGTGIAPTTRVLVATYSRGTAK